MGSRVSFRRGGLSLILLGSVALTPASNNPAPDFGEPLAGLTDEELERFDLGKEDFEEVETVEEGLGPSFNDTSCAGCHVTAAIGGGGTVVEMRFGRVGDDGLFDSMPEYGGSLVQDDGIGNAGDCTYVPEIVPPEATISAGRRTTPLFGLGLVDAVPDETFWAIADQQAGDPDGIAGLVSVVTNLETNLPDVGKFGWKAQVPTLFQFSGDAYLNEMGITSPLFPDENCPQGDCASLSCNPLPGVNDDGSGVEAFRDFMTFLAPPPRGRVTFAAQQGEEIFRRIGCESCHKSTLKTGPNPVAALHRKRFHPYSDFLLHDMGSLGDGITQNEATGQLMRTAPLWGVRRLETLLHDGRASTLEAAILAHDGQGKKARDRYARMSHWRKSWVLAFLNSL